MKCSIGKAMMLTAKTRIYRYSSLFIHMYIGRKIELFTLLQNGLVNRSNHYVNLVIKSKFLSINNYNIIPRTVKLYTHNLQCVFTYVQQVLILNIVKN